RRVLRVRRAAVSEQARVVRLLAVLPPALQRVDHAAIVACATGARCTRRPPEALTKVPAVRLNSKPVIVIATVLGILLIALAIYYWAEPAKSLASFVP